MAKTSLALPGFYTFGVVNIGADVLTNGITLASAFPDEAIKGEQVNTVIFCSHESNSASGVIYIGDLNMGANPTTTAALTLLGPNIIQSFVNQNGLNTIPLGNIKFNASAADLKVRVSVIVG
jgi:hypothetical protein